MPLILPGNVGSATAATGYNVANSVRFNGDAYVHKAVVAGNQRTFTYSFWTKRSTLNNYDTFIGYAGTAGGGGSTARGELIFVGDGDDTLRVGFNPSASSWSNYTVSDRVFRDPSAWYHIVLKVNTTSGTEAERLKIFVNGVSQGLSGYPSQNFDTGFNVNGYVYHIGRSASGTGNFIKGYLTEAVFIDGTALDADSFGEFDSDSGIWKPIDVSGLTFGNNGFYLETKQSGTSQNSSGLGADTSGNDNHFAVNNLTAIDQSTDTCTNNFATLNPLDKLYNGGTFTEGNLKVVTADSIYGAVTSTIGINSGKWYAEFKATDAGRDFAMVGIKSTPATGNGDGVGANDGYAYYSYNGKKVHGGTETAYGDTYDDGDIIGVAVDLDNNKIYWSKNGTFQNSGDPTTGSTGTGSAYDLDAPPSGFYFFSVSHEDNGDGGTWEANFGSPPFAISSGNTDGNGYGNFEYAVPSSYYSLNTKNLAEYG